MALAEGLAEALAEAEGLSCCVELLMFCGSGVAVVVVEVVMRVVVREAAAIPRACLAEPAPRLLCEELSGLAVGSKEVGSTEVGSTEELSGLAVGLCCLVGRNVCPCSPSAPRRAPEK